MRTVARRRMPGFGDDGRVRIPAVRRNIVASNSLPVVLAMTAAPRFVVLRKPPVAIAPAASALRRRAAAALGALAGLAAGVAPGAFGPVSQGIPGDGAVGVPASPGASGGGPRSVAAVLAPAAPLPVRAAVDPQGGAR